VYFTLKQKMSLRAALAGALLAACSPALAETAYIAQVSPGSANASPFAAAQPVQLVPTAPYAPRPTTFVPTPETAMPARFGNVAQTIQVFQAQAGGNNYSNVGVWGGKNNDIGVLQGGRDLSNLNLINTQGLSIAVIQPPGSAPLNMLIARLPNGGLLIKR
jgi:hypothetical protein